MDAQNNTALVTGGRGFIGRAVVKLLQRSGCGVVSLDATPGTSSSASRHEIECDLTDVRQLQRVFEIEAISGIIHLAAILPTAAQREPARATEVNVQGSLHLLEMARGFGVRRFVFGSSLSVYGTCHEDQVVTEACRAAPEDLYGVAKLYVEQLGAAYRQYGLEFVSLRIGRVVGSGARSASSAWRSQIFELLASKDAAEIAVPYAGSERILLVHVDDVARMLVGLMEAERPAHTVYNAACESVVVADLKREVEGLNSNIRVELGEAYACGNPRLLDSSRFRQEFGSQTLPIFDQLKCAAEK
jgi:nucleoside-diphosphate-sugar epimerase